MVGENENENCVYEWCCNFASRHLSTHTHTISLSHTHTHTRARAHTFVVYRLPFLISFSASMFTLTFSSFWSPFIFPSVRPMYCNTLSLSLKPKHTHFLSFSHTPTHTLSLYLSNQNTPSLSHTHTSAADLSLVGTFVFLSHEWEPFLLFSSMCQFHQHFTHKFFVWKSFWQLFSSYM